MEAKGAVNQYELYYRRDLRVEGGKILPPPKREPSVFPPKFTLNLAAGTTPFMCHFAGVEYASNCYRLTWTPIVVTHVWYRPAREQFEELDPATQEHVLNGGLLLGELGKKSGLADDPVRPDWTFDRFGAFCLEKYGRKKELLGTASDVLGRVKETPPGV